MGDNAVNPLLIPLIIKEVYKRLDFSNKKSFRLVCKTWIDTILDLWRKQTKLVIKYKFRYNSGGLSPRPQTADTILNYFDLYKIGEKPLLNLELFRMNFSFFPLDLVKNEQNKFTQFFSRNQSVQNLIAENFGHSVEWLELVECEFLQEGMPEAGFYYILLKYFPKLKALSVRYPYNTPGFPRGFILNESLFPRTQSDLITLNLAFVRLHEETVKSILNLIPNLKNLSLRGNSVFCCEVFLSPLSSSGIHILLERLGIDFVRDIQDLCEIPAWIKNYLEAARPPLKCLKALLPFGKFPREVDWFEFPEEPFIYKSIWNCVGNTLTSLNLRIKMGLWSWCTLFTGYSLPNLTHLCLNFRELKTDVDADLLHFDFGMLRGAPLLQKLHLELEALSGKRIPAVGTNLEENQLEWRGRSGGPIVLEHMKDFRFELYHKPTEGCWRAFAAMMPNLRELQGMVDENTEPLVRQLWPDLKLKWSTALRRVDHMRQNGEMEVGTVEFGNAWQDDDWENWEGKRDYV